MLVTVPPRARRKSIRAIVRSPAAALFSHYCLRPHQHGRSAADAVAGLEYPHAQTQPAEAMELVHARDAGPDDNHVVARCHASAPDQLVVVVDTSVLILKQVIFAYPSNGENPLTGRLSAMYVGSASKSQRLTRTDPWGRSDDGSLCRIPP